eukprot:CAMPEP_0183795698 /NCGR_PEP_ID=MMETSP0803_2-20130417/5089_1 /TAXON_ID=195967 /ORGANISM="Crustomastix stigmata, Strain CCMP3273" /LENGTH=122 /DNA_ID=CAMNT_0026040171 /DNA_START=50 /DNA_END=418 /DNA_ORIENTATION=+
MAALRRLLGERLWIPMARTYQGWVGASLKKYGLRYDDLLDPKMDQDTAEAIRRLPQHAKDARNQRLKRAMDLSMKHVHLPKEMQQLQTPFDSYLEPVIQQVKLEAEEKVQLGSTRPYERTIP